ncbi:MAG: methylmalonyl Co-A mutase-associated GTPase MeaB [candidate division Zixibacteria bacterium]|nr:methylmalonyl Co-A mutase-associated GTPase MeaB [candidate division Zixibacteria bacterium]
MDILDRFVTGDIRALSRVITMVENYSDGYQELLGQLYRRTGRSVRIGVTGPPGAGKSTIVNCLAHKFLDTGKKVGIVAVDPSSPFTGGALLGDRVRMNEFSSGDGIFFRSMATRGATGGLSFATDNVTVVLDAFGFDVTLVETVGVGQVELDIVDACDTVIVVLVPESGDSVQTMKAGLLEIANIMVVNKTDRPGSESIVSELEHTIHLKRQSVKDWPVTVIGTEAVNGKNIGKLFERINEHVRFTKGSGHFDRHRHNQIRKRILNILRNRFQKEFLERLGDEVALDDVIDDIHNGTTDPFTVTDELYERFSRER